MSGKRFLGLDGLRGVCALTVLLFHAANLFHQGPIFQHGYLAVDMFFLLSGFVIAFTHEERLKTGMGLSAFLRIRARRLLPVFWIGASFNIAVFLWMTSQGYYPPGYGGLVGWVIVPFTTLLMLPPFGAPGDGFSPAMNGVNWSLMVEWLVNIAYAAIAFRLRTRTLAIMALAGWVGMTVASYHSGTGWSIGTGRHDILSLGLLRGTSTFLAGVVLYRLHARGWFARLPAIAPELLLTSWFCIAAVPVFTATPTFDWITVTLLCPLLMLLLLRVEDRAPSFCRGLGELSYPLYTVHSGIILLAQGTPLFGLNHRPDPLRALLVTGLCIAAAWLVHALSRLRPLARQPQAAAWPLRLGSPAKRRRLLPHNPC